MDLIDRIVTIDFGILTSNGIRTYLIESRVSPAFDAPSLIIRQMPVKSIELDTGHKIKDRFHGLYGLFVTARIQHKPPVRISGRIIYGEQWQLIIISLPGLI